MTEVFNAGNKAFYTLYKQYILLDDSIGSKSVFNLAQNRVQFYFEGNFGGKFFRRRNEEENIGNQASQNIYVFFLSLF